MTRFFDSLGYMHELSEPLLKAAHATFPPDQNAGAFRLLVDDLTALRDRRSRLAERVKVQTVRQRPARPAKPLRKSLADLARDAQRMTAQVQRGTEAIQRRTARALISDLTAAAKAGRLGAIEAAKVDALRHRHARALGLETTGVRR